MTSENEKLSTTLSACDHPSSAWVQIESDIGRFSSQRLGTWCRQCGALNTGTWRLPKDVSMNRSQVSAASPRGARDYALEECASLLDSCEAQHRACLAVPVDDKHAWVAGEYQRLAQIIRSKLTPQKSASTVNPIARCAGEVGIETIWKFELEVEDQPSIEMPVGARVLSVGTQGVMENRKLLIWAYIPDSSAAKETRHFFVLGTGNPIPWSLAESVFVGTVQMGTTVWHVWDQHVPGRTP